MPSLTIVWMAGRSVSRTSQVTLPLWIIALSLAASGGPSSRTLKPVSFSNGANITSRRLLAHEPPQLTTMSSPLSARAGRARKNGPTAAAAPAAPATFTKLLRVERVQSFMSVSCPVVRLGSRAIAVTGTAPDTSRSRPSAA